MNKQTIKELLRKHNIRPLKKLGQNFLIDKKVLEKIIEAAELPASPSQGGKPTDIVLEIGPGLGILTIELAKRTKKVIAIEKDRRMCKILKEILKNYKNIEIINKDVLKIASPRLVSRGLKNYKIVANLPYYITSPVIRKFLEAEHKPKLMVLMVQKEVAQRICAEPGKMSLLSVAVQFYAKPEIISYVSKKSFYPVPKVDSAIIKITPYVGRATSHITSHIKTKAFFNLVKKGFSSKRKMLKNNLNIDESILKDIGLNPRARAENLSIDEWIKLLKVI